jgi:hypothetical protein
VVYVRRLKDAQKLALRIPAPEIKSFVSRLHQPFLLKAADGQKWELNTYAQFYERFEPRACICSEADVSVWPEPPDPTDQMEFGQPS